jgi:uroporphyrinogen-III decarboxylase
MTNQSQRPANWPQLTHEQKRAWRFQIWQDSVNNIRFISPEARQYYQIKLNRLSAVLQVKEPDRVPVSINAGMLPYQQAGLDYKTAIYQPEKALQACLQFNEKFADDLDMYAIVSTIPAGAFDILGYRLYTWPGHGMADSGAGFQFVEDEYMRADEYDDLIRDPSDFWLRSYLPRIFGSFSAFKQLNPLTDIIEVATPQLTPLTKPEIQAALQKLLDAGKILQHYNNIVDRSVNEAKVHGSFTMPMGSFAKAPFDTLGDTLRGTSGIMKDMYRQPAKLLKALDIFADITINSILKSPGITNELRVSFPLHKGADGWMSQKQFETFYWPSLKKIIDALIQEGLIINLFAEGSYNTRLDYVNLFPKGTVHWHFDQSDMAKAKKALGANCSIEGNVPTSLLVTGTPAEMKEYCRKLIDICAPGGGFILGPGATAEFPRIENIKAMVDTAREYGAYPFSNI